MSIIINWQARSFYIRKVFSLKRNFSQGSFQGKTAFRFQKRNGWIFKVKLHLVLITRLVLIIHATRSWQDERIPYKIGTFDKFLL